jgi:hypothetical protein
MTLLANSPVIGEYRLLTRGRLKVELDPWILRSGQATTTNAANPVTQ